jgi:hypothetical protein
VSARRLVLHIGTSKSGTTAFQRAAVHSRAHLSELGVGQPYPDRDAVGGLLATYGWEAGSGFVNDPDADAADRFVTRLRGRSEPVLMVSSEDLCELRRARAQRLVTAASEAGFEVHVVITARDWGRQLPSEWQQFLKHRLTDDFATFLDNVRERRGFYARHFWRRQDLTGILHRWSGDLPSRQVHVVAVPRLSEEPEAVFGFLAELLGVPPEALVTPGRDVNASFGHVEAEVYRRLNVELTALRPGHRRRTFPAVRGLLASGVLKRGNSARVKVPPAAFEWVRAECERQLRDVLESGVVVHGSHDDLLPREEDFAPMPELSEAEVAQAAVETLAAFASRTVMGSRPRRRQRGLGSRVRMPVRRWRSRR